MSESYTLIFDIGKTNKKLYIFNENFESVFYESWAFDEIMDDDGFPSENLPGLAKWIVDSTKNMLKKIPQINKINFSAYGASLVHLDNKGEIATPFYNYLKPFPEKLKDHFFKDSLDGESFAMQTSSPFMGFLNSGLQLIYLKYERPMLFKRIKHSLHFPQYLSSLLSQNYQTEYTSLGCHTGIWNFNKRDYAKWVIEEGLENLFPEIHPSHTVFDCQIENKSLKVGIGVHDSSSALIPYLKSIQNPFVLISTGTWSICINPFNSDTLTKSELQKDCLNFMGVSGKPLKASRLFLGQELKMQTDLLSNYFQCDPKKYKSIKFDQDFKIKKDGHKKLKFKYFHLNPARFGFEETACTAYGDFNSFGEAYHHLMDEFTNLQICSLQLVMGQEKIQDIYIDGGFSSNDIYLSMLAKKLPQFNIYTSDVGLGSALGAALLVHPKDKTIPKNMIHSQIIL